MEIAIDVAPMVLASLNDTTIGRIAHKTSALRVEGSTQSSRNRPALMAKKLALAILDQRCYCEEGGQDGAPLWARTHGHPYHQMSRAEIDQPPDRVELLLAPNQAKELLARLAGAADLAVAGDGLV